MELLQLYYFKALAEREHLTQTAQSLMIAAPTLSATISRLEKELGVKLFDRVGRNIQLNENGRILLKYVNEMFNAMQNARTELRDLNDLSQKRVTVATTAESLWTKAIHVFLETHPDIHVVHDTLKLDDLNQDTVCGKYDFIITAQRDLIDKDCWVYSVLYHDWPVLVFNEGHPFGGRESVDLIEAKYENFVALSKGYSSRRWFDETCAAAGFQPLYPIGILRKLYDFQYFLIGYRPDCGFTAVFQAERKGFPFADGFIPFRKGSRIYYLHPAGVCFVSRRRFDYSCSSFFTSNHAFRPICFYGSNLRI